MEVCSIYNAVFKGVFSHAMCVEDITFKHIFLEMAVFTVSFLNIRISIPNNAGTLWECSFKKEFYTLQRRIHNSKFVFFQQSGDFS